MLSKRILKRTADEISRESHAGLAVADLKGRLSFTSGAVLPDDMAEELKRFAGGKAGKFERGGRYYAKVRDREEPVMIIASFGSEFAASAGRLFERMIGVLFELNRDGTDKDDFFCRLFRGDILPTDAAGCASELGIRTDSQRSVYVIMIPEDKGIVFEDRLYCRLKLELSDHVTVVSRRMLAVIHDVSRSRALESRHTARLEAQLARCIRENTDGRIRVGCGCIAGTLCDLSASYREAVDAVTTAEKFGRPEMIHRYDDLLVEQLVSALPVDLCRKFLEHTTGPTLYDRLDPETLKTAETYIDNTMNASETSRQLYFHRNTLRYRLSHIQVASGLDIRKFRDASIFKLGSVIHRYMKTKE